MITFDHVSKTYPNGVKGLVDINLTIPDGEYVSIIGLSGAGKSTLAKAVAKKLNILHVDTGAIYRTIGYAAFSRGLDAKDESQICLLYTSPSPRDTR